MTDCAFADCAFSGHRLLPPCDMPSPPHHMVEQQKIKRRFPHGAVFDVAELAWRPLGRTEDRKSYQQFLSLSDLLADPRNLVQICRLHHELLTNHRIYLDLTSEAQAFADEFGFAAGLEADRARRVA